MTVNGGLTFRAEEVKAQETDKRADWQAQRKERFLLNGVIQGRLHAGLGIGVASGGSGRWTLKVKSKDTEV